jgi:hypothetical protein
LTKNERGILDDKNLIPHRFCVYERNNWSATFLIEI